MSQPTREPIVMRYHRVVLGRANGDLNGDECRFVEALINPIWRHLNTIHTMQFMDKANPEVRHLYRDVSTQESRVHAWFFLDDVDHAFTPSLVKILDQFHVERLRRATTQVDILVAMEEIRWNERISPEVRDNLLLNGRQLLAG